MMMIIDDSISREVNTGDFTLRDFSYFTKILLNEISPARNSLLLLAVFEILHITAAFTKILCMFLYMKLHSYRVL